jgi:Ca2+-transporting ATPase
MQYAVALSLALLLAVTLIPFLQPAFNTTPLSAEEWRVVLSMAILPAIAEELTKLYLRWKDRGLRAASMPA